MTLAMGKIIGLVLTCISVVSKYPVLDYKLWCCPSSAVVGHPSQSSFILVVSSMAGSFERWMLQSYTKDEENITNSTYTVCV